MVKVEKTNNRNRGCIDNILKTPIFKNNLQKTLLQPVQCWINLLHAGTVKFLSSTLKWFRIPVNAEKLASRTFLPTS